ncbi:MAG: TIGR02466 family protein [Candidatus Poseidoniales archaeon]
MEEILERVNAGEIVVIDDFVPAHVQDDIEQQMNDPSFPWKSSASSIGWFNPWQKDYTENTPSVYDTPQMCNVDLQDITSLLIDPNCFEGHELVRTKANLKYPYEHFVDHSVPHSDGFGFGVVGLYYVNESDGDTVFFNEKVQHPDDDYVTPTIRQRIAPKKGTMVFFHKGLLHAAGNPSKYARRIVINFNFAPNKFTFVEQICDSPHGKRKLSDHLLGVYKLLEGDGASQEVCDAGLFHSIYGTEVYRHKTLTSRDIVRSIIGDEAENLAHMFCELKLPREKAIYEIGDPKIRSQLLDIHEANEIEQEDDHMGLNFEWFFPTIFAWEILDVDTDSLEKYAFKLKEESEGRVRSNAGGWQSYDLDHNAPELSEIRPLIASTLDEYWSRHNYPGILRLDNMWINISGTRNSNNKHVHPNSIMSGVFYIKVPKTGYPGNINFTHPYYQVLDLAWGDIGCHDAQTWREVGYTPEVGKIVLFPSWAEHYVERNDSNEWRISLSFNTHLVYND